MPAASMLPPPKMVPLIPAPLGTVPSPLIYPNRPKEMVPTNNRINITYTLRTKLELDSFLDPSSSSRPTVQTETVAASGQTEEGGEHEEERQEEGEADHGRGSGQDVHRLGSSDRGGVHRHVRIEEFEPDK